MFVSLFFFIITSSWTLCNSLLSYMKKYTVYPLHYTFSKRIARHSRWREEKDASLGKQAYPNFLTPAVCQFWPIHSYPEKIPSSVPDYHPKYNLLSYITLRLTSVEGVAVVTSPPPPPPPPQLPET